MKGGGKMEPNFNEQQQQFIDQLLEQEQQKLTDLQSQVDTLQAKEAEIKTLQDKLFAQTVSTTLKENGLLEFAEVINVTNEDELKATVEKLTAIVESKQEVFEPSKKRQTTAYDQAYAKGDTVGMIGSKLGKLFK